MNLTPNAMIFHLRRLFKITIEFFMKGNHLKEGVVPADSYDDLGFD